jgi:hypothetical protein
LVQVVQAEELLVDQQGFLDLLDQIQYLVHLLQLAAVLVKVFLRLRRVMVALVAAVECIQVAQLR